MPINYCIQCTLPLNFCVCAHAPRVLTPKACSILFHPREVQRRNSSGRLLRVCTDVQTNIWHRLKNEQLESKFQHYGLIYPNPDNTTPIVDTPNFKGYLWIDSTWQESQKMLRQSPWLQNLPKISIDNVNSDYRLRRNQREGGMSTLESMAQWLKIQNQPEQAEELLQFFQLFQNAFLKARQAGLLK